MKEILDQSDEKKRLEVLEVPKIESREVAKSNSEISRERADDLLESRLNVAATMEIGSPERSKHYQDIAFSYMNDYRRYEREANTLQSQINRKLQPESRRSEVDRLRRKAREAKQEADKYNRYARMEL